MAKIVSILIRCDVCASTAVDNKATEVTININGTGTYCLDLCPRHTGDLLGPLQALVGKCGVLRDSETPVPPVPASATAPAPAPMMTSAGPAGMTGRLRRNGKPYGKTVAASAKIPVPCPACDVSTIGSQAMAYHLRARHGLSLGKQPVPTFFGDTCPLCMAHKVSRHHGLNEHEIFGGMLALFEAARAQGDPHGVVERQMQAVREWIKAGRVLNTDHVRASLHAAVSQ